MPVPIRTNGLIPDLAAARDRNCGVPRGLVDLTVGNSRGHDADKPTAAGKGRVS
jgi:hypothetical protein